MSDTGTWRMHFADGSTREQHGEYRLTVDRDGAVGASNVAPLLFSEIPSAATQIEFESDDGMLHLWRHLNRADNPGDNLMIPPPD